MHIPWGPSRIASKADKVQQPQPCSTWSFSEESKLQDVHYLQHYVIQNRSHAHAEHTWDQYCSVAPVAVSQQTLWLCFKVGLNLPQAQGA